MTPVGRQTAGHGAPADRPTITKSNSASQPVLGTSTLLLATIAAHPPPPGRCVADAVF
jgi:hypothetical protein